MLGRMQTEELAMRDVASWIWRLSRVAPGKDSFQTSGGFGAPRVIGGKDGKETHVTTLSHPVRAALLRHFCLF